LAKKLPMEKTSIRKKLNTFGLLMLLGTMTLFILIEGIMGFVISSRRFSKARISIENDLLTKGMTLVSNNGVALRGIVEDNAFTALREIVATTVRHDADMVYGIFMDESRKPWVMTTSRNPDSTKESPRVLNDSISMWAHALKGPGYLKIEKKQGHSIMEFAAPIIDNDGKNLGVIRYGISTSRMWESVQIERRNSTKEGVFFMGVFVFMAGFILITGLRFARRQANTITAPIELLTKAAYAIAQGDYDLPVKAITNDEIGSLADNFEQMRITIKQYTGNLEKMVADRTQELKETQKELVEKAHQAGMADIAAGTLHNVGNLLNSVKASVETVESIVGDSPAQNLVKANQLLRENIDRSDEFILNDPRGKKLLRYYLKIEGPVQNAWDQIGQNVKRVIEKINAINDVIAAQQSYAGVGGLSEKVRIADIIEDAVTMQRGTFERHQIRLIREYSEVPEIFVQKTKLIHIIVNVIKNAKEAMLDLSPEKKFLALSITMNDRAIFVRVKDPGCGIAPENITKIFSHGFTTKKDGHGFGLHSCANYMNEMGGKIWAESEGLGKGASFVLQFNKGRGHV
jgi:signal transduction histidine kinase